MPQARPRAAPSGVCGHSQAGALGRVAEAAYERVSAAAVGWEYEVFVLSTHAL